MDNRAAEGQFGCVAAVACAASRPALSSCVGEMCVEFEPGVEACILAAANRLRRSLLTRPTGSFVSVKRGLRGRPVYAFSGLPISFGFLAASAGCCHDMRARQHSTHFPSADVLSPVRVTNDALKKQDCGTLRSDDSNSRGWERAHLLRGLGTPAKRCGS